MMRIRSRTRSTMFGRGALPLALALAIALSACGDDSPTAGEDLDPQEATVEGRVERTIATGGGASGSGPAAAPARQSAAEAAVAAVAEVRSDGGLEILQEADVRTEGTYEVEGIAAGRSRLLVSVRDESGAEVGRVVLHQETEEGGRIVAAPVTAESTVQGLVVSSLQAGGAPEGAVNRARLSLTVRMDESTAAEVAASTQETEAVAEAYLAAEETLTATVAGGEIEVDAATLDRALAEAAVEHDRRRHEGEGRDQALEAYVEATLDALEEAGVGADAQVLLTAAIGTALDRTLGGADARARLDIAKHAVRVNLRARERLAGLLPESAFRARASESLAEARLRVDAAASISELVEATRGSADEAEEALVEAFLSVLPEETPEVVRATLEARVETAFARADFSTHVDAAATPVEIASAVVSYREAVRDAVEALVEVLPDGAGVSVEATAALLIAVRGGPGIRD